MPKPTSDADHERQRFVQSCESQLLLPGLGYGAADIDACVSAIAASGCTATLLPACDHTSRSGTLSNGSPCVVPAQCKSSNCSLHNPGSAGDCGICVVSPCGPVACAPNEVCATPFGGTPSCAAITYGDVGAACNLQELRCKPGVRCDVAGKQCHPEGGAGAPCQTYEDCADGLTCPSSPGGSSKCSPGTAGDACLQDQQCPSGFGCDYYQSRMCQPITWAAPGQPCGRTVLCAVGVCPLAGNPNPVCPQILADGTACMISVAGPTTCDQYASCVNRTCQMNGPNVCR